MSDLENLPVMFMTARVQAEEVARLLEPGADQVISRLFDPMALSDEIRKNWSA